MQFLSRTLVYPEGKMKFQTFQGKFCFFQHFYKKVHAPKGDSIETGNTASKGPCDTFGTSNTLEIQHSYG